MMQRWWGAVWSSFSWFVGGLLLVIALQNTVSESTYRISSILLLSTVVTILFTGLLARAVGLGKVAIFFVSGGVLAFTASGLQELL